MYPNYEVLSLEDIGYVEDIIEDGESFFDNAMIKAKTISNYLKSKNIFAPVIADDSGLCVEALGGEPGIYSARYSGEHGNNEANRRKILDNLKNKDDRTAYFICVLVKYFPDGSYISSEGRTYGKILEKMVGDINPKACYDCLFYSDDLQKCFGEVTPQQKNSVSHRGRAIKNLVEKENMLSEK